VQTESHFTITSCDKIRLYQTFTLLSRIVHRAMSLSVASLYPAGTAPVKAEYASLIELALSA
jgi:hypothetical protein